MPEPHSPVHDDGPPEDVGEAEHVELLQTLPGLAGEGEQPGPLLHSSVRTCHSHQAPVTLTSDHCDSARVKSSSRAWICSHSFHLHRLHNVILYLMIQLIGWKLG